MKNIKLYYIFLIVILFTILINLNLTSYAATPPAVLSEAAILINPNTNEVLFSKNAEEKMFPASTTKILTAILTIENVPLTDVVTASEYSTTLLGPEYSSANIQVGEQLTVEQLLQMLLVVSANDAALILAEHVGGNVDNFIIMMNEKAEDLGLTNTHFDNCYGGHSESHYTTASDLANLMYYCIQNPDFVKLSSMVSTTIPATTLYDERTYTNTNQLIIPNNKYYYQYTTSGKTGFTTPAGNCLVTTSNKDNLELICVILGGSTIDSESTRFIDSINLFDYGFSQYSYKTILDANSYVLSTDITYAPSNNNKLNIITNDEIVALVNNDIDISSFEQNIVLNENLTAPISEGQVVGTLTYTINNETYSTDLIAFNSISASKTLIYLIGIITIVVGFTISSVIYSLLRKDNTNIDIKNEELI